MARRLRRLLLDSPEWAWLAFALALRAAFALKLDGAYYQSDEHNFVSFALSLARLGAGGGDGGAVGPPVPGALFALGFRLFGPSLLGPRLLQSVVGTFAAAALGRATAALTRSREAGRIALLIACVYPFFIYYGGMLLSETSYIALIVPALALIGLGRRDDSAAALAGGAFLLGLAALARAEAAPIGVLVLLSSAAAARTLDARTLRRLAVAGLCWTLPILAWCARNRAQLGTFALDIHGGYTLLYGTEYYEANQIDTSVAQRAFEASDLYRRIQDLPAAARDRAQMREAFAWMAAHPGATSRQWADKAVNFWRFYPRLEKVYEADAVAAPAAGMRRAWLVAVSLLFEPALILGGLAGLWRLRRMRELWPQAAFVLGTMGVHVASVSQMRYRLSVMPMLILGAAALAAGAAARTPSRR
jgi:4-amino-4-deoxy-L-arabinose transferase-like glycosyltransferase